MDKHQTKQLDRKNQRERFEEAARKAGADMTKQEFTRVIGRLAKPAAPANVCLCGCGVTVTRRFLPGHDQKLRTAIEDAAGGLEDLKKLVEDHLGRPIKPRA